MKKIFLSFIMMSLSATTFAQGIECRGISQKTKEKLVVEVDIAKHYLRYTRFYAAGNGFSSVYGLNYDVKQESNSTVVTIRDGFRLVLRDGESALFVHQGYNSSTKMSAMLTCQEKEINENEYPQP